MAIAFRGSATGSVIDGGTLSVTLSGISGLAEGDIVFVSVAITDTINATPDGWLELDAGAHYAVYYKIMGETPDTSVSFGDTGGSTDSGAAVAMAFSGAEFNSNWDISSSVSPNAPDPPSVTPASDNNCILVFGISYLEATVDTSVGTITNYSTPVVARGNDSIDSQVAAAYRILSGGSGVAQDPAAFSGWATTDDSVAFSIALEPSVAAVDFDASPAIAAVTSSASFDFGTSIVCSATLGNVSLSATAARGTSFSASPTIPAVTLASGFTGRAIFQRVAGRSSKIDLNTFSSAASVRGRSSLKSVTIQ